MFRPSRSAAYVWVLLFAVLFARMGGVHLHLCFDGQEPPATVHVMEDTAHHADDVGVSNHNDQDVDLSEVVLAKKAGATDFLLFAIAVLLLVLPRSSVRQKIFFAPAQTASLPLFFHPPLRGPPL